MTPTIEEVLISYESVSMCNKRKHQPNTDLLNPKIWDFAEIKVKLSLVKAEWMDKLPGPNIPFRKLNYRFGQERGLTRNSKRSSYQKKNGRRHVLLLLQYACLER